MPTGEVVASATPCGPSRSDGAMVLARRIRLRHLVHEFEQTPVRVAVEFRKGSLSATQRSAESEVTATEADKQELVVAICAALHRFGCTSQVTRGLCAAIGNSMKLHATFLVFPSYIAVSFHSGLEERHQVPLTRLISINGANFSNMSKLDQTHQLCAALLRNELTPEIAELRLQDIIQQPSDYSTAFLLLTHAVAAGSSCVVWFGGNWAEGLLACLGGVLVGLVSLFVSPLGEMGQVE
eukprot:RCo015154